ncbi:hypothetical protein QFZ22_002656 [Streptomyces canus]|uniref:Uncharacterized protein n=1 Tax=Streptomyces canus TaxID=58343 RepID=A0AAW8FBM1_9ACTN|nr:hypothetical protein [Streptomyces canus]MDQ0906671.1 hypothetical protein [Streptomyces canus]
MPTVGRALRGVQQAQAVVDLVTDDHTNIKLRQVSEQIVDWVHDGRLSDEIRAALEQGLVTARSGSGTAVPEPPPSPGPTEITDRRRDGA